MNVQAVRTMAVIPTSSVVFRYCESIHGNVGEAVT